MPRRKVESPKDVQCKNNALWVVLLPMNKNKRETIEEKPFISVFSDKKEADAMLDRITKYADPDSAIKPYIEEVCLDDNTLPKELKVCAISSDDEVMAVYNKEKNIYGVQFHPESVLTPNGYQMIKNFLRG